MPRGRHPCLGERRPSPLYVRDTMTNITRYQIEETEKSKAKCMACKQVIEQVRSQQPKHWCLTGRRSRLQRTRAPSGASWRHLEAASPSPRCTLSGGGSAAGGPSAAWQALEAVSGRPWTGFNANLCGRTLVCRVSCGWASRRLWLATGAGAPSGGTGGPLL